MSRRRRVIHKEEKLDARYGSPVVARLIATVALLGALIAGAAAAYFAALRILGFSLHDFRHDRPAAR